MTKICSRCKAEKSLDDFYLRKDRPSGYKSECKSCSYDSHKRWVEKPKSIPQNKTCSKCKKTKSHQEFWRRSSTSNGLHPTCKDCGRQNLADYRESSLVYRDWWNNYYKENKNHINARNGKYQRENRDKQNVRLARYRFLKQNGTYHGLFDDEIKEIYIEARRLTEETGIPHHVDHIVPISHPKVCGLHVPWNLQILTKEENLRKGNSFQ